MSGWSGIDAWAEAATLARAGRWAEWSGLPDGVTVAAAFTDLAGLAAPVGVPAALGRRAVERHQAGPLRVWSRSAGVVLVEWVDPACATGLPELLDALGTPDRDGPGRHLRAGATTTERVYPGRGLAVTVAASYDQPASFAPYLATVQLFAATDLRTFVLELGGTDRPGPRSIDPRGR